MVSKDVNKVYKCTKEDPWSPEKSDRAIHPDADCIYDGGWDQIYEIYKCPHCNLEFEVNLPDY